MTASAQNKAIFLLLAVFLAVLIAVKYGALDGLDRALLLLPRSVDDLEVLVGGGRLRQAVNDFTALGGLTFLFSLTMVIAGYFFIAGKGRLGLAILLSVLSGWMVSASVKFWVGRDRPDIVPHLVAVHDTSFPSGHAMVSAVTYLTLGALLARAQTNPSLRVYVLSVAVILTGLVGASRVFLGVHFPTDVIAGWLLGACWSLIALRVTDLLLGNGRK